MRAGGSDGTATTQRRFDFQSQRPDYSVESTIVMSQIEIVTNQRSKKFFEPKMLEIKPN